jgi:hypothetical protein
MRDQQAREILQVAAERASVLPDDAVPHWVQPHCRLVHKENHRPVPRTLRDLEPADRRIMPQE